VPKCQGASAKRTLAPWHLGTLWHPGTQALWHPGTLYCTLTATAAFPLSVNTQVRVLFPPLEQAPDQIASRPFDTLNVMRVPLAKDADPEPPTATLIPAGLERTRSPLRPVALTVSVSVVAGGGTGVTVSVPVRVTPALVPLIVAVVEALTAVVVTLNVALVWPAATVTLAGTVAAALLLESVTTVPPPGAALVRITVPCEGLPPTTLAGFIETPESEDGGGAVLMNTMAERVTPP
jgi:hypothetical protein